MKFEKTEVYNFDGALRGMRNPLNSWDKSDSYYSTEEKRYVIGENDLSLAQKLISGGSEHRKFLRQIFVSVDITAPMYWFSQFDTYKVGTVANSTSKMHKLASEPITIQCFETSDMEGELDALIPPSENVTFNVTCFWADIIYVCEYLRRKYLETKNYGYWKELLRILPESWLQKRTITLNYENIRTIYFQRRNHKLKEWTVDFCEWVESLPYAKELIMYDGE